jgi:hypothetical protein
MIQSNERSHITMFDPIRILLTLIVIIHHVSITYGGSGDWYYREAGAPERTQALLSVLTATDQSYFMGFFFLMAGYLTPTSLARKGESAYLGDRMWRLGFPILVFGYLLQPLAIALSKAANGADFGTELIALFSKNEFGFGPLWFNKALIIFAAAWCFFPLHKIGNISRCLPSGFHARVAIIALFTGAAAFFIRLGIPVGKNIFGMQIGYFSSYIVLFITGAFAARARLLENIEWKQALPWIFIALLVFPTIWIYMIISGLDNSLFRGGWNISALIYAMWEPFIAAGVILLMLAFFRRWKHSASPVFQRLGNDAFIAFVIHAPVAVGAAWIVKTVHPDHFVRFLLAAPVACIISFFFSDVLTQLLTKWKTYRRRQPLNG